MEEEDEYGYCDFGNSPTEYEHRNFGGSPAEYEYHDTPKAAWNSNYRYEYHDSPATAWDHDYGYEDLEFPVTPSQREDPSDEICVRYDSEIDAPTEYDQDDDDDDREDLRAEPPRTWPSYDVHHQIPMEERQSVGYYSYDVSSRDRHRHIPVEKHLQGGLSSYFPATALRGGYHETVPAQQSASVLGTRCLETMIGESSMFHYDWRQQSLEELERQRKESERRWEESDRQRKQRQDEFDRSWKQLQEDSERRWDELNQKWKKQSVEPSLPRELEDLGNEIETTNDSQGRAPILLTPKEVSSNHGILEFNDNIHELKDVKNVEIKCSNFVVLELNDKDAVEINSSSGTVETYAVCYDPGISKDIDSFGVNCLVEAMDNSVIIAKKTWNDQDCESLEVVSPGVLVTCHELDRDCDDHAKSVITVEPIICFDPGIERSGKVVDKVEDVSVLSDKEVEDLNGSHISLASNDEIDEMYVEPKFRIQSGFNLLSVNAIESLNMKWQSVPFDYVRGGDRTLKLMIDKRKGT